MKKNPENTFFFDGVSHNVDFPHLEREALKAWEKNKVLEKYLKNNNDSKKTFSFLDGPITANNPMGVHHAWGRTYKDFWQRYKNMCGYRQRFQNGFDCQGLWVEVEVEKELGLKSKKDIENLVPGDRKKSIDKFIKLCKERVYKYAKVQTEQSKRLGYFMDWDNSYFTLSDENNYMIWHFLKKCSEKNLIYKGRDSVPWCPRCGTAISQHEILTEDYKEIIHDSLFIPYKIKNKRDEYLLIWTTTAWTLPANVAVAVDPKITYVVIEKEGKKYYMAEDCAKRMSFETSGKIKGEDLINLSYESPFDNYPRVKKMLESYEHKVVASDERILPVLTEEGTGLVHVATGAGTEDFALGKKENLPVLEIIDESACYMEGLEEFTGKNAKEKPELIINHLKENGALFLTEKYKHRYPVCWRCKTELVWRVVDEWYISIDPIREDMKDIAKKIKWIPGFGLKRELDWLENMHDWLISKKRYWGLALPIWECDDCGKHEVIGGFDELKKRAITGWKKYSGKSPHRPWIDEVKIKCTNCDGVSQRIPDVGNPWLDAGIVPFSTISKSNSGAPLYKTDEKMWREWFPVDFITESFPGQFKNWFYSLIAESTVLENEKPFKTVLGFATLMGEDGEPMHKSTGNMIEFNEAADKIGVDVMRWMYLGQNYTDNLLFGYKKADEVRRRFHLILWNIYRFFVTYANLNKWKPEEEKIINKDSLNILDIWLLLRFKETIIKVTEHIENYRSKQSTELLEEFINDFSSWYIRRSRDRVNPSYEGKEKRSDFFNVTYFVLVNLSRILTPFTPFISDEIYTNLKRGRTGDVHLSLWPVEGVLKETAAYDKLQKGIINDMALIRRIVEKGHSERKLKQIPVRQPLSSIKIVSSDEQPGEKYLDLIKEELNVKEVLWKKDKNLKTMKVTLDIRITKQLKEESEIRNLARNIQIERKRLGFDLLDRSEVTNPFVPSDKKLMDWLRKKTSSSKVIKGKEFKVRKVS